MCGSLDMAPPSPPPLSTAALNYCSSVRVRLLCLRLRQAPTATPMPTQVLGIQLMMLKMLEGLVTRSRLHPIIASVVLFVSQVWP